MPRRPRGAGSIHQRPDDLWEGRIDLTPPGSPVRRRRSVYGKSFDEVQRKMLKLLRTLDEKGDLPTSNLTVEKWLNTWLEDIAARDVKPTTLQGYRSKVKNYLTPHLGRHKLDKLKAEHVRGLDRWMQSNGLSQNTRRQTHVILSAALARAVREGKCLANAAEIAGAPAQEVNPPESLSPVEIRKILRAAKMDPMESRWLTALLLGLRQGECLGLGWRDVVIDDDQPQLTVTRALATVERKPVLLTPKSKKSVRPIPLPRTIVDSLKERRTASNLEPRDSAWAKEGLVWSRPDGSPLHPRQDYQAWHDLLDRAGVTRASLHTARHSAATTLAMLGVPLTDIMAILGHSNVAVTLRYIHPDLSNLKTATDAVDRHWRELEV